MRREEEEQRRAEEERAQALREAALLQKQVREANPSHLKTALEFKKKEKKWTLGFVLATAARGRASQGAGQGGADTAGAGTPRSERGGGPPSQKEGDDTCGENVTRPLHRTARYHKACFSFPEA